jgi:thiol:disulfide interchange protein DsbD
VVQRFIRYLRVISFLLFGAGRLYGQSLEIKGPADLDIHPTDVIIWQGVQALSMPDGRLMIGARLTTKDGFSIYQKRLTFEGPSGYGLRLATEPPTRMQDDPMGDGPVAVYDGGDFEIELKGDRPFQGNEVTLRITFLGCTSKICLFPYTQELKLPVYVSTETTASASPLSDSPGDGSTTTSATESPTPSAEVTDGATQSAPRTATISEGPAISGLTFEQRYAAKLESGELSWSLVLLVVFLGGVATNLTPCVFPMIPITLRLLAKQGQRPVTASIVYASGIVLTYTGLGLVASLGGGVFGSFLAHPGVNIAFGILFLCLGATMLGFGDLSKLQNLGAQLGSSPSSSYLNALGMGAGAGLVAAPCTGPIMAALLAYATKLQSTSQSTLLFFVYSAGFALPYVFLGFAARRVASFKVSPRVQVGVKMLFAAAMVGLAFYYFKNPAYQLLKSLSGYWWGMAAGLLAVGLILSTLVLRNMHLLHVKSAHLLPTLVLGLGLFAGVQWATGADVKPRLHWLKDEASAYALAIKEQKPILVDGWADWCVACKQMDQTTFVDPEVISLLQEGWVYVKLDLTELNDTNEALAQKYDMQGLPTLVLIPPSGDLQQSRKLAGYVSPDRLLQELRAFSGK